MLATWLQLIDGCEEAWEELDGLFGSFDPPIGGLLHQVASSRESIALARALLDAIDSQQLIVADASEDRSLPTRIHARFGYHDPLSWLRKCCLRCIELSTDRRRVREAQEAELTRAIYNLAYGLSHEINNPLANISARAQLLLARAKSDDDRKTLATIIDQSHRAHEMLAEVMLVVQPPLMVPKAFAVAEAIRASSANLSEKAKDKGIRLTFELPALPIRLYVDEQAIVEALSIGLRNAIEACQAGDSVRIYSSLDLRAEGSEKRCCLCIADTGPGLSGHQIEQAFDLFYSGREAGRGLGLGLAKLKRLVVANGGELRLVSAPNAGARLELEFPVFAVDE